MKYILVLCGILGLDLGTKDWVDKNIPVGKMKKIAGNTLFLRHIKNDGMAYHKLAGKRSLLLYITGGIIAVYSYLFCRALQGAGGLKRYRLALAVTLGGALGNFLERWKKGAVTDFIYIKMGKNAPIFNVADLSVFVGAISILGLSGKNSAKK